MVIPGVIVFWVMSLLLRQYMFPTSTVLRYQSLSSFQSPPGSYHRLIMSHRQSVDGALCPVLGRKHPLASAVQSQCVVFNHVLGYCLTRVGYAQLLMYRNSSIVWAGVFFVRFLYPYVTEC